MTSRQERKSESKCYRHVAGSLLFLLCLGCLAAPMSRAQEVEEQTGINEGNYNIKQSIEFGYRFTDVNGSQQTYDTMVNLQQGPRLLGFTTEFRSLDHHGTFFDDFYLSNFGYGGDPNDVSQIRLTKNKWYCRLVTPQTGLGEGISPAMVSRVLVLQRKDLLRPGVAPGGQ